MERMLHGAGYTVQTAGTGEEGFELARANAYDVILSDMRMSGISGIDVLRRLRDQHVDSAFIIMTGFGTVETAVEAMKLGAVDFVQKPFFRDELLMRVRSAADRRQLTRQVDLLQRQMRGPDTVETLLGESDCMRRVKTLIVRAAAAPGTVLVTGETGTGKELVARAVHAASGRGARSFVALNCAALADSLLENELFGHVRGAFTGAQRRGRPHRARPTRHAVPGRNRDDAGGAPGEVAARARVGRGPPHRRKRRAPVDVRFVAATNTDLQAAVDARHLQSDLFYRLNVHRIHLPPLRERTGDVEILLDHFSDATASRAR